MPELPDVEIFRQYLAATSLHRAIETVEVQDSRILTDISAEKLQQVLKKRRFQSAQRHGKHLLVRLEDDGWLTLHFGMTGY